MECDHLQTQASHYYKQLSQHLSTNWQKQNVKQENIEILGTSDKRGICTYLQLLHHGPHWVLTEKTGQVLRKHSLWCWLGRDISTCCWKEWHQAQIFLPDLLRDQSLQLQGKRQQIPHLHGTEENPFQPGERNRYIAISPGGEARTVTGMRSTAWEGQESKRPHSQDSKT